MKLVVLASGTGSNLQALLDTVHERDGISIAGVASDKPEALALSRARDRGVATAVFPLAGYADRAARDVAMADWAASLGASLVVLAGYMALLDGVFLRRFPGAVINVHPSLLPAYPGLRPVERAVADGCSEYGVTVHFVDEGVDSGPIILQRAIELPGAADPEAVLSHLQPIEHTLLPEAVRLFARGEMRLDPSNPRRVLVDR